MTSVWFLFAFLLALFSQPTHADPRCTDGPNCHEHGLKWRNGWGVARNCRKAVELWKKGCALGHRRCCEEVRDAYEGGYGVPYNPTKAKAWAAKAEALPKSAAAKYESDVEKLRKACLDGDDTYACWRWARTARPNLPALEAGCALGDYMACWDIKEGDPARKREVLEKACLAEQYSACRNIVYETPKRLRKPWKEAAYRAAKRECEQDYDRRSCEPLAWAHVNGWAVPKAGAGMVEPLLATCERGDRKICGFSAKHIPAKLKARLEKNVERCKAAPLSDACYAVVRMCDARVAGACQATEALCDSGAVADAVRTCRLRAWRGDL